MTERSAASSVREAGAAERKFLTMLFADLSGYTRLTVTHDPEDVLVAVGPLLASLRDLAQAHGGYVASMQGDGFMAVFGAPVSHADDPRRAIDSAVAMRAEVDVHRTRSPKVPDVHIGIASGEILVTHEADGHAVIGPAVNLAARLSDSAAPGEILVDEASAALTADHALFGTARVLTLRGFTGGVRAMPLTGLLAAPRAPTAPLAGRHEELAMLERALGAVRETGASALHLLVGEPGAGKSHLVSSWAAGHPELAVLQGSARPYGSALPLSALTEALLGANRDENKQIASDFMRLMPQQRSSSPVGREPDEALAVAARRWLSQIAAQGPTVLILEDLHWADDALVETVQALHANPVTGPLLVVGTSREPLAGLPQRAIPPLSPDEIRLVVEQRTGARPDPGLLDLLAERSGGNALWLVECLALLHDRGQLAISHDVVAVRELEVEIEVPASIRMLISARLDNLTQAQKRVLQRASVHPGEIAERDWPGDPEDIDAFAALGLIEHLPSGEVRFTHGLIREAIYSSMARAARVREHEQVLATSTDPATRAYAALEMQRLDVAPGEERRIHLAAQALTAVTDHATYLRRSHTKAARDVLLRAEDLCLQLDLVAPRAATALLTELAEVLRDLDEGERSRRAAERAVALAEVSGDQEALIRAELALGEVLLGSDKPSARRVAESVLARSITPASLRGRAWQLLANSRAYDDMAELQRCLERAFDSHSDTGDVVAAAETARLLAYNLSLAADSRFDHWLGVATANTASDHLRGQGELALVRALVAQARGESEESWKAAESAMALLERAGLHLWLVDATALAVEAATATGRRAVLPGLITKLSALIDGHRARVQVTGLCATAPALMLLGREEEAERALRSARALLPSVGKSEASMVLVAEGHSATLAGRHDLAEVAYAEAERLAAELGFRLAQLACRLQRLQAQVGQGSRPGLAGDLLTLAAELDAAGATAHSETARLIAESLRG